MYSLQATQESWQIANGDYIDMPAFGASEDGKAPVWDDGSGAFVAVDLATAAELSAHTGNTSNPHAVTAAQAGAYTIANADAAIAAAVATHAALTATHGVSGAIVGTTDTQTLTSKTLTLPIISQISNTGTLTLPTSTDTLVGRATTDTLTNKTLTTPTIASFANAAHTHQNAAGGGQLDHGLALTGLSDDDHTQYLLVNGSRASTGEQTFTAGIVSPHVRPASNSVTGYQIREAGGTAVVNVNTTNQRVGIRTTAPRTALEVVDGGGAIAVLNTLNDNTNTFGRLITGHYSNAEEGLLLLSGTSGSTSNVVQFGGGSSIYNAATQLEFYTAANNATVSGTKRMVIDSSGRVGIGTISPNSPLDVTGTIQADGLRLDVTPAAETPSATHTVTININGTDYKFLCLAA